MLSDSFANSLIPLREAAYRLIFKIDQDEVLNPHQPAGPVDSGREVSQQLKTAVNEIKRAAIDDDGRRVDYARLKDSQSFLGYTQELIPKLHTIDLQDLGDAATAATFWINLYNALVIHAVIAYGIKKSVFEDGAAAMIRFFRRAAYTIGGLRFSLEDIEHGVLRANRGNPLQHSRQFAPQDARSQTSIPLDPRIHFALNCASKSCPPIAFYSPEKLDQQLDLAAANFIQQEVQLKDSQLWLSQIFKWYQRDFGGRPGVALILTNYLPVDDPRRRWLADNSGDYRFRYAPYDWTLNF